MSTNLQRETVSLGPGLTLSASERVNLVQFGLRLLCTFGGEDSGELQRLNRGDWSDNGAIYVHLHAASSCMQCRG